MKILSSATEANLERLYKSMAKLQRWQSTAGMVYPPEVLNFRKWKPETWGFVVSIFTVVFWVALISYVACKVVMKMATNQFRTYIGPRKSCKSWICSWFYDQCDLFFQITTFDDTAAAAVYLGTLLGPPIGLKFVNNLTIKDVILVKGWFKDTVQFRWHNMSLEYQGSPFKFPDQVHVGRPMVRRKLRHFFDSAPRTQLCNVGIVNQDNLIIRQLKDDTPARPSIRSIHESTDLWPGCFDVEQWDARITHCYHHFLNPNMKCNDRSCPAMVAKRYTETLALTTSHPLASLTPSTPVRPPRPKLKRSKSVVFPSLPTSLVLRET